MKETGRTKTGRAAVKVPGLGGMRNRGSKRRLENGFRLGEAKTPLVPRCLILNVCE